MAAKKMDKAVDGDSVKFSRKEKFKAGGNLQGDMKPRKTFRKRSRKRV